MLILTIEELNLIAIYKNLSRATTLEQMQTLQEETTEDAELNAVIGMEMQNVLQQCIAKLSAMSDRDYDSLDFTIAVFD